ncbi:unnamed protein product [Schistocephalus solidus]|uniref:Uncharacterized protein n=1 Tax=Schistocephalus solidus TaxID=70667 RepID=A0A183T113_SCHSO|nr:unnamed protein product [Schistocephalus solidus]
MTCKTEEIQGNVHNNEWKNIFTVIKVVYDLTAKGTSPLFSTEGSTLITEKTQILKRWAEQLKSVSNRLSTTSGAAIDRLPQVETNANFDLLPSLQETIMAVQQLFSGKAP